MKNINWSVVATIIFLIAFVVFVVASFMAATGGWHLGYYGIGLLIAGWVCYFIGLKTR